MRINSPHYLCKIHKDLSTNKKYTLVVSQYEKNTTIFYTLRAYSVNSFELKEINNNYQYAQEIVGEWKEISAGGCQNHPLTYKNNPQYRVTITPHDTSIFIVELRGPKSFQIGMEIVVHSVLDEHVTAPFVSRTTGNYRSGFCVLELFKLPAGVYHVRPSTYLPKLEGPYFIKFKSASKFTVEQIS